MSYRKVYSDPIYPLNLTAEARSFSGTFSEYSDSHSASLYWNVGGGPIFDSSGDMKGMSVGFGFGGRTLSKLGVPKEIFNKGIQYEYGVE